MKKNWNRLYTLLGTMLAVGAIALIMGATAGRSGGSPTIESRILDGRIVPRVQIINFNDTVARFDSATGDIHVFSGDLRDANTRGQWRLFARGVSGSSGFLQFQQPRGVEAIDAPFLVDLVTGDTWLLRRRGSRGTWDAVRVFDR